MFKKILSSKSFDRWEFIKEQDGIKINVELSYYHRQECYGYAFEIDGPYKIYHYETALQEKNMTLERAEYVVMDKVIRIVNGRAEDIDKTIDNLLRKKMDLSKIESMLE